MKTETLLIVGGLAFIGYWYFRRTPNAINIDPPKEEKPEPKTIVLNLKENVVSRKQARQDFLNPYIKEYNTSKKSTVAPPAVTINEFY